MMISSLPLGWTIGKRCYKNNEVDFVSTSISFLIVYYKYEKFLIHPQHSSTTLLDDEEGLKWLSMVDGFS